MNRPGALSRELAGALSGAGKDGVQVEMPLRHSSVSIDVTAFVTRASPF